MFVLLQAWLRVQYEDFSERQRVDRIINTEVNNLIDAAGDYSASLATGFTPRFNTYSNIAYVNGQFHTGPIAHDFVAGSTGYKFDTYSYTTTPSAASVLLGPASVANPVLFPIPAAGLPGNLGEQLHYQVAFHYLTIYRRGRVHCGLRSLRTLVLLG